MDYFDDVFISFLNKKALRLNLKYLKLCPEDERGLTGLGRHEGESF